MRQDLITHALGAVESLTALSMPEWDLLVRQARSADLTARLAVLARDAGVLPRIPAQPRAHLESALVMVEAQAAAVIREVGYVRDALAPLNQDLVLLKGAAYLLAGLPASRGRLFADLDILVPKDNLPAVEATLMLNGWASTHHNAYDQRYYRQWMHELPPMLHIKRMTVIDVHHAIVPATASLKPSSAKLLEAARPVPGMPGIRVLAPTDMILHSATHLFYNEEFSHGLRDMSDLDMLLRHFSTEPGFWNTLLERALALGLERPLYYCLRYCSHLFATPIPEAVLDSAGRAAPSAFLAHLMDRLWMKALTSRHPSAAGLRSAVAQQALYFRAHWHKMPAWLLAYHMVMKSLRREERQPA